MFCTQLLEQRPQRAWLWKCPSPPGAVAAPLLGGSVQIPALFLTCAFPLLGLAQEGCQQWSLSAVWLTHLLRARPCSLSCGWHKSKDTGSYHCDVFWSISRTATDNRFLMYKFNFCKEELLFKSGSFQGMRRTLVLMNEAPFGVPCAQMFCSNTAFP